MNPIQESKQELEAAIRYAENAISKANQTIESMATYQKQTGREQALERDLTVKTSQAEAWRKEYEKVKKEADELRSKVQGQYEDIVMLEKNVKYLRDENERLKAEVNALEQPERPTMPVIPKAVAIAIFREGMQHGVESACTELEENTYIRIEESEYVGDFHVTFERDIDLNDHIDTDWMREKCGDHSEEFVVDALSTLCSDKEFECRIHGVDDEEILRRDWKKKDDQEKDNSSS